MTQNTHSSCRPLEEEAKPAWCPPPFTFKIDYLPAVVPLWAQWQPVYSPPACGYRCKFYSAWHAKTSRCRKSYSRDGLQPCSSRILEYVWIVNGKLGIIPELNIYLVFTQRWQVNLFGRMQNWLRSGDARHSLSASVCAYRAAPFLSLIVNITRRQDKGLPV